MQTFRIIHNKLVRDKVLDHLKEKGINYKAGILKRKDRIPSFLFKKLHEEITKLQDAAENSRVSAIANIYEVLEQIAREFKIKTQTIRREQKKKRQKKGGFTKKILLYWTEIAPKEK